MLKGLHVIWDIIGFSTLFALASTPAWGATTAAEMTEMTVKADQRERTERSVDVAALSALENSQATLLKLLKKYRGTSQEPVFLQKLAELQQQNAAIQFRIAHGAAHHGKKQLNLTPYKTTMRASIRTLTELVKKYPHTEGLNQAYFMRGKAYEETDDVSAATQDYLHLTKHYPESDEAPSAYMALAEFSIKANDHQSAVRYLTEVEKRSESPHYPFALYKLAWSHYNLKNIPKSLGYAEKNISFYQDKKKGQESNTEVGSLSSEDALLENILLDSMMFFLEGYEQKLPQYQITEAMPYIRKLEKGPMAGRMFLRYAKLLRSHGHENDLNSWKNQILSEEYFRPEALDVLMTTAENQINKRRYTDLAVSAKDFVELFRKVKGKYSFAKAHKLLLDTAESFQELIIKNKGNAGAASLSVTLASIYDVFTQIVDESDPRIPQVHYNLAETLFEIKDFEQSTAHYRWVVEHQNWGSWTKEQKSGTVADASLKAIASRYEVLKSKNLIPTEVKAKAFSKDKETELKVQPLITEWVQWIDTHVEKTKQPIDRFYFEANRTLYQQGDMRRAVERMIRFAKKNPETETALPSASLALDSYIASSLWDETYELAIDFQEINAWKTRDFSQRLFAVAADASYKKIELAHNAKDYEKTVLLSDRFLKTYSKSERLPETLTLAGSAATALKDPTAAKNYYSRLIAEVPHAPQTAALLSTAYVARASIAEDNFAFRDAARDLRDYLHTAAQTPKDPDALRRKILALAWLSDDAMELKAALESKTVCSEKLATECDRYSALQALTVKVDHKDAYDRAKNAPSENRGIWAAVALEKADEFTFRDRLILIRQVASHWNEMDSLVKYRLLPSITQSIPHALKLNRTSISEIAPLRADEKYITRRIEAIREIENAITKVMNLPWAEIKAQSLNEMAALYIDLASALQKLPPPKTLAESELGAYEDMIRKIVIPFEEKGNDLRAKAYEMSSVYAIQSPAYQTIATAYFEANPSQAKAREKSRAEIHLSKRKPVTFDLRLLDALDSKGDWDSLKLTSTNPMIKAKAHWAKALKAKNWQQIAFFSQELKEHRLEEGSLGLVKAVSLATAGAQAEAIMEIETVRKKLEPKAQFESAQVLIGFYWATDSREKIQALIKALESTHPEDAAKLKMEFTPQPQVATSLSPNKS